MCLSLRMTVFADFFVLFFGSGLFRGIIAEIFDRQRSRTERVLPNKINDLAPHLVWLVMVGLLYQHSILLLGEDAISHHVIQLSHDLSVSMAPQSIPELFLFAVELLLHPLYLRSTPRRSVVSPSRATPPPPISALLEREVSRLRKFL